GRDARVDDEKALLLPETVVDRAFEDAGVADNADHVVALDELLGLGRDLVRLGLLGLDVVLDRVAVDAAVGVDAGEVGVRHIRDVGERGPRLVGDDPAQRDRRAGGLDAWLGPALRRVNGPAAGSGTPR